MNHTSDNCIFCKIISGSIPCAKVYEDEHVFAFLDISQATKGHTLVIPKTHRQDVFELEAELAAQLFSVVPKLASAIKEEYGAVGFNLANNNGEAAGQTVFHFHLHLLPRYGQQDGFTSSFRSHQQDYTIDMLNEMADTIRKRVE